jgi:hypothetical protein
MSHRVFAAVVFMQLWLLSVNSASAQVISIGLQSTGQMRNGLPATTMDSFVNEAGWSQDLIYGDEGTDWIPPYFGFTYEHRINAGIFDQSDEGLTTGHGSYMPSAWGADEFLAPPGEWSESGANYGNPQLNGADAALDAADQLDQNQASAQEMQAAQDLANQAFDPTNNTVGIIGNVGSNLTSGF